MVWSIWPIFIIFSFIFINVIIKIDHYLYCSISYTFAFLFCISLSHFLKNISHFSFSFAYIYLSHSLLCISNFSFGIFNFSFTSHTINNLLLHTMYEGVSSGYVSILLNVCNLLSSSLLIAILLTSSV